MEVFINNRHQEVTVLKTALIATGTSEKALAIKQHQFLQCLQLIFLSFRAYLFCKRKKSIEGHFRMEIIFTNTLKTLS